MVSLSCIRSEVSFFTCTPSADVNLTRRQHSLQEIHSYVANG